MGGYSLYFSARFRRRPRRVKYDVHSTRGLGFVRSARSDTLLRPLGALLARVSTIPPTTPAFLQLFFFFVWIIPVSLFCPL